MKRIYKYSVTLSEGYRGMTFEFESINNVADFIRTAATHHIAEDEENPRALEAEITPIYGEGEEEEVDS